MSCQSEAPGGGMMMISQLHEQRYLTTEQHVEIMEYLTHSLLKSTKVNFVKLHKIASIDLRRSKYSYTQCV
jgi:hypothetical protein